MERESVPLEDVHRLTEACPNRVVVDARGHDLNEYFAGGEIPDRHLFERERLGRLSEALRDG